MGRSNQSLFMYGLFANFIGFIGAMILVGGLMILVIKGLLFGTLTLALGIGVIIKASAMRFNFQRKSGTIIHRGDW